MSYFIRGKRVADALEEDATMPQLHQNIVKGFPNTKKRQHVTNEVNIRNVEFIPFDTSGVLRVSAEAISNGTKYVPTIQFRDVQYMQGDTITNVTFTGVDGKDYSVEKITLPDHTIKVNCNCMDFYYRFATNNYSDDALDGDPPPLYHKKTDRPPVNPMQVPGVCKHLLKLVERLKQLNVVS